jgi:hypothetical protein
MWLTWSIFDSAEPHFTFWSQMGVEGGPAYNAWAIESSETLCIARRFWEILKLFAWSNCKDLHLILTHRLFTQKKSKNHQCEYKKVVSRPPRPQSEKLVPQISLTSIVTIGLPRPCGKIEVGDSNVNDIETKRREPSIMGIFAKSKRNEPVE